MEIVAEGIQRPDQAERLRALHCDLAQGFYFGRPMPDDEMDESLEAADASLRIVARAAA
jgi:EAL domain-containing protein (putative c-di-GMP-specific phosphodiesterase class I)